MPYLLTRALGSNRTVLQFEGPVSRRREFRARLDFIRRKAGRSNMNSLVTLNFPTGKIGFGRTVRGWDEEPRNAFRVELPDRPMMYGEWRTKFADNGNDFDVEIIGFGYLRESHLGSAYPPHRKKFSAPERGVLEEMIRALFADKSARV